MSLTPEQCEEFWNVADKNGDGKLTIQELASAVKKYRPGISDSECAQMFCGIDRSGDKVISKDEFIEEMQMKKKRSATLMELFKEYDTSGDGTLSRDELRKLIKRCFKPEVVEDTLTEFFKYSDNDGDGAITFDEFRKFFG